jgi:2-succinyl-5-enolpyruvyl-6-hydroxy-3-cyclohexene-1-carboxylate synthase
VPDGDDEWLEGAETLDGRPGGQPWTRFSGPGAAGDQLDLPWTERGVVVCGDGDYDARSLVELAGRAGWPVLAEPSSGARHGPAALSAYQYLLATPEFVRAHQPDLIVSAGRPGLSRPQLAFLKTGPAVRHVVMAQGPGRWADPQRAATDVASALRLTGTPAGTAWLDGWQRADEAARRAVDAVLDEDESLTEPRLARDLATSLPDGALLWCGSSQPVRDIDCALPPRADLRVLASRGTSGIDGTTSSAIGAALAHGGPAFAVIGDLTFLHDAAGLALGPDEPRPDLCLVVVNNDGGGIFSALEQAAFPGPFERVFGTPHGTGLNHLAAAFGLPYQRLEQPGDLAKALQGTGLRVVEAQTSRAGDTELRARLRAAAAAAVRRM